MSSRSFVSPRHKSRGDPRSRTGLQSGQAIVRESAESPVMKVYLSIWICDVERWRSLGQKKWNKPRGKMRE